MEETQIVSLHLKDLRVITGSLENIILKSLGPKCQQTLLTSSTGQMTVTCSGFSILSALHVSHPVAKVIVDSITSFYEIYGDGCKTIIIYVHELLSAIELYFNKLNHGSSPGTSFRATVSRSLYECLNSELVCICDDVCKFISTQNCQEDVKCCQGFERPLYYVILACLQGLPGQVCDHLADILTTFVMCTAESGLNFNVVQRFLDNFLFVLPNQTYTNSCISEGLFLQGSVFGQRFSVSPAKLIFLQCPLEGHADKQRTDGVTVTSEFADSLLTYRIQVASRTLQEIKNAGVSLILTVHKVPPFVLQICHSLDLSVVACLADPDIDLLMYLTGKLPVTSVYDGVNAENILTVASWEHTVIAGKHFVHLMFDERCVTYKPYALFVYVPSESFCQQIKMYVKKLLKVANHCLLGSVYTSSRECFSDTSTFLSGLNNEKTCSTLIPELENPSPTDRSIHAEVEFFKSKDSLILKNITAAGGYFEHVLIYFLKQYTQKNMSSQRQLCCNFIMKMLEAVPKILHNNQLVSKSGHCRNFLCSQNDIKKAIDVAVTSGVTTKAILDCFHNGAFDVLNIKFEMVFAAINLVVKLLRIEYIVGVHRVIKERHKCDMELDDDDME